MKNKIEEVDLKILKSIENEFSKANNSSGYYVKKENIPRAYFNNINKVKVIVLGCDPSYSKVINNDDLSFCFNTVFGLSESDKKRFGKSFFSKIERNLEAIDLTMEDIYVQNLCKTYFNEETSAIVKIKEDKNDKDSIWDKVAKKWIKSIKYELDEVRKLDKNIPVLLTSYYLVKPLLYDYDAFESLNNLSDKSKNNYYKKKVTIKSSENLLERTLIPFFRGPNNNYYSLNNKATEDDTEWNTCKREYRNFIKGFIK